MTFFSAVGIAAITVWNLSAQPFSTLGFCLEHGADFLACVTRIPFVEQIFERSQLIVIAEQRVIIVVDRRGRNAKLSGARRAGKLQKENGRKRCSANLQ